MSKAYDALAKLLEEKKRITPEDIEKAEKEHGKLTDEEKAKLKPSTDADKEKDKEKEKESEGAEVTMEEFIQASVILDTADKDSEEYKKAKKIVETYEAQA